MGNKRIYLGKKNSKYAKLVGIPLVTIISLFSVLTLLGFEITGSDDVCYGTPNDPCVSYGKICNLGSSNYDIYNPDGLKLDFSPAIKYYWIFFKDGRVKKEFLKPLGIDYSTKGWRYENFTNATKPRKDRLYVHRFARYSCQEYMLVVLKNNPSDTIKWGMGVGGEYLDPVFLPPGGKAILNSTRPLFNTSSDNLTAYPLSNNTIKVIYNWYLNDKSFELVNMPFEGINGTSSNNAWDYSGYSHTGSEQGTPDWQSEGGYDGKGTYFFKRHDSDWINIPWNQNLNFSNKSFSVTGKIFINETPTGVIVHSMIGGGFGGSGGWIIGFRDDTSPNYLFLQLRRFDGVYHFNTLWNNDVVTNSWHSFAVTFTAGDGLNINDSSVVCFDTTCSFTNTTGVLMAPVTGQNFQIGTRAGSHYLNGSIDDLVVWNRSLTIQQIYALHRNKTNIIVANETNGGEVWRATLFTNNGTSDTAINLTNNLTVKYGITIDYIWYEDLGGVKVGNLSVFYCGNVTGVKFYPNLTSSTYFINTTVNATTGNSSTTYMITDYNASLINQTSTCGLNITNHNQTTKMKVYISVNETFTRNTFKCGLTLNTAKNISVSQIYITTADNKSSINIKCWGNFINATTTQYHNVSINGSVLY